ncbi:hypothetical protein GCM10022419_134120 [Nonomuraea rosea]|uniref:Uncharacterized protein n=1 Tax=Nonomuraea rosea TaxID=638574 RepID=A0ABP7A6F9_9ACTN
MFTELSDLDQTGRRARERGQVDGAAVLLSNGEGVQQHTQPAAVHETDLGHVEKQLVTGPLKDIAMNWRKAGALARSTSPASVITVALQDGDGLPASLLGNQDQVGVGRRGHEHGKWLPLPAA